MQEEANSISNQRTQNGWNNSQFTQQNYCLSVWKITKFHAL